MISNTATASLARTVFLACSSPIAARGLSDACAGSSAVDGAVLAGARACDGGAVRCCLGDASDGVSVEDAFDDDAFLREWLSSAFAAGISRSVSKVSLFLAAVTGEVPGADDLDTPHRMLAHYAPVRKLHRSVQSLGCIAVGGIELAYGELLLIEQERVLLHLINGWMHGVGIDGTASQRTARFEDGQILTLPASLPKPPVNEWLVHHAMALEDERSSEEMVQFRQYLVPIEVVVRAMGTDANRTRAWLRRHEWALFEERFERRFCDEPLSVSFETYLGRELRGLSLVRDFLRSELNPL